MVRRWLKTNLSVLIDCVLDAMRLCPQGVGREPDPKAKDAYGVFITLFAFVATQGGALAFTDQLVIPKWASFTAYILMSLFAIAMIQRLLRLTSADGRLHYDRGTIAFGVFVFYISIVASIALGFAYLNDWLSPRRPVFKDTYVQMTTPVSLRQNADRNRSIVHEYMPPDRAMSLQQFANVLTNGLMHGKTNGDVSICWSRNQFNTDYAGFRCELFDEIPDPTKCLAFLYAEYRTDFADSQSALRQLHFETKESLLTRVVKVGSPLKGDRLVLVFWSDSIWNENAAYSVKQHYGFSK